MLLLVGVVGTGVGGVGAGVGVNVDIVVGSSVVLLLVGVVGAGGGVGGGFDVVAFVGGAGVVIVVMLGELISLHVRNFL